MTDGNNRVVRATVTVDKSYAIRLDLQNLGNGKSWGCELNDLLGKAKPEGPAAHGSA